ncbi:MAG: acyltransferase domain-containing protein, partial [Mycobacteriaceae bacterium]|nr:acyltransferase domain-containing protein [Mycobacteriaceae bacterium]
MNDPVDRNPVDRNAIAIIGMACRFPGAPDLAAFWDLLDTGRDGLTHFDDADLDARGVPADLRGKRNYVPVGGLIDGQDRFDPEHFGFTPAEAAQLDPQLRLLLESAWDALGDAGHLGGGGLGTVGVFTGAAHSDYLDRNLAGYRRRAEHDPMGHLQATMGAITDYFPQQLAYRLNLTGPAVAVQATCASSLVAVHTAAQSLLLGECDAALAGGVSLIVPQGRGYLHLPDSIFSADGRTRAFGAEASGMVYTQGVGVVLLRRLDEALADGDPVYAVLRGSAVNNDGAGKAGFTAPSATGQARVVAQALAAADVDVDAVGLIEAHGTATALGDQIELSALAAVFGSRTVADPVAIGSVKSSIGHANTAAGVASLIKAALALHHRRIPATLHADPVHPETARHCDLFEVVHRTREWRARHGARIACVSSFGLGGTNCHAVLEQAPAAVRREVDRRAQLLVVSAAADIGCRVQLDRASARLTPDTGAEYAATLLRGRHAETGWRAAAVAPDSGGAHSDGARGRATLLHEVPARPVPARTPEVVFAFPGAGSQYSGMGAGLYRDEPEFRRVVDECATVLEPLLHYDIRDIVTGGARHDADDVRYGQPALFAVSVATAATLRAFGVRPTGVIGHSLGEYAAAVVAGLISLPDAARLVAVRSRAAAEAAPGAMLAVAQGEHEVTAVLTGHPDVVVGAVNAPDACVLSGPAAAVDAVAAEFARTGVRTSRLRVNAALHSPAVAGASDVLRAAAAEMAFRPGDIPMYSTLTGAAVHRVDPEHWVRHLCEPVQFSAAVRSAAGARPTLVVECGPGDAVAALARRNAPGGLAGSLTTLPDDSDADADRSPSERSVLLTAVGHLWCAGVELDPDALHPNRCGRIRLPGDPFQRRTLWTDPPAHQPTPGGPSDRRPTDATAAAVAVRPALVGDQQTVAALWADLLGVAVADADADFFALGGNSMLATRMLEMLSTEHQADIRLRELLAAPTVSGFAELLERRRPRHAPAAEPDAVQPESLPAAVRPFPLTRVQHAYWIGRSGAFGLSDVGCHIYLEYDCDNLDLDRYQQAWNSVIRRHDMLRAVITDDGRNQILAQAPDFRIRRHHVADLPEKTREDSLADLRRQLSHRVHRPDRWPLFDVRAAIMDTATTRIFVGIDALICDAASFMILDRDLRLFYRDPAAAPAPVRARFADYIAHAANRADSPARRHAAAYWRRRMDQIPGPPRLPTRSRTQTRPWFGRRHGVLDAPEWRTLRQLCGRYGVTPSAVLLTAYADVLAAWSGDARFTILLTLVDRPAALPGIDDVVGDFTTLLAHETDRTSADSFADRVKRTQRQLFDDIDHRDYSALELMAELSSRTGERRLFPVVFTSALDVGELVGGEVDLEWAGRVVHGVSQTPQVWLDHQAFVHAGTLQLQWDVLETVLDPDAADTAFGAYLGWLRLLVTDSNAWTSEAAAPRLTNPGDDLAQTVAAIWAQVLDIDAEAVRPESTFVALGGDSVLAVRMATLVRGRLGVAVPVVDLVGDQTLAQLVAFVAERRSDTPPALGTELARQADPAAPFPLTPLQQAYWVGQQGGWALSYSSAHNYVDFRLSGVDADGVDGAVRSQVRRQPMLRAIFRPDGSQQVLDADDPRLATLPITHVDLRTAVSVQIDEAAAAVRAEMQQTGPTMDPWPFRITAIRLPGGQLSLHIVCSLLVADGWSVQLMYTELFTYLDEPNTVLPPLTAHFGDYVATVTRQRGEPDWQAQRDWWWNRLDDLPAAPALPLAVPFDQARPDGLVRRQLRIPGVDMDRLRARCTEYGITPTTVFATCYAIALARLAGHRRFLLNVLYLNRLHLPRDLDHAVGPYAGTVLLDVALPSAASFLDAARHVQEATGRMLDHGQVTGVEVVRELSRRRRAGAAGRAGAPQAPVVFHSTLGLHPPGGTPDGVEVREFYQRVRTPQVALDLQVFQWDWDDAVVVNLDAVAELFSPGVLDDLFADIRAAVTALVQRPQVWEELVA